jgi:hypothetical protein
MGVAYNPRIVTNGLVLALDAGNAKSYPGSGTTWTDLSGRGNNGTMFGSVPFTTDYTQCFDFATASGVSSPNSSLGFSLASAINSATGNYSFECWIKSSQTMSQQTLLSNAGGADGFRFGPGSNGVYILCGPTYTEGVVTWVSAYDTAKWHQVVAVFDRNGSQSSGSPRVNIYLDGKYQNYIALPSPQTSQSVVVGGIVKNPCCQIWTGKLSSLRVYANSLTATEVLTNFYAGRGRHNI